MNKLISFSSVSKDKLDNNKIYWGGPPNYGGLVWNAYKHKFKLNVFNIANISNSDFSKLNKFADHIVPNSIKNTVTFKITHKKGIRQVKLLTDKFVISKSALKKPQIKDNFVVISPIINEYNLDFYKFIFDSKPKAIFLDIYNNDNSKFNKEEITLFNEILKLNKTYKGKLFIKLSDNEAETLLQKTKIDSKIYLIITCGKDGAKILKNKKVVCSVPGIKEKVVSALGAGDVFLYSFVMFYSSSFSIKKALIEANKIAAYSTRYLTIKEFYYGLKNIFGDYKWKYLMLN